MPDEQIDDLCPDTKTQVTEALTILKELFPNTYEEVFKATVRINI